MIDSPSCVAVPRSVRGATIAQISPIRERTDEHMRENLNRPSLQRLSVTHSTLVPIRVSEGGVPANLDSWRNISRLVIRKRETPRLTQ